jgi:aldehyde dehydrogenase (NAD+)
MALRQPPVHLIGKPGLRIGEETLHEASGGTVEHFYAATGQPTSPVVLAGASEIDLAVSTARAAQPGWRDTPVNERRNVLLRFADLILAHAEELSDLQTLENGLPVQITRQMAQISADWVRYNAGWADKGGGEVVSTWPVRSLDYTVDEPYGVIGGIIPWNGSLMGLSQLAAPALATGNTIVVKPSELAPFVAGRMADLAVQAGLPPGALVVVTGGAEAGQALTGHPGIDKVHFTGGKVAAKSVLAHAAANLTPVALELGGKSPHLIFEDADIRFAARMAMSGIVALSGQGCANGTRLLVHRSVRDQVLEILLSRLRKTRLGDPADEATVMGPVVSQAACDRILGVIERGRESGQLVAGGARAAGELAGGFFVEPTVFADVDPVAELAQEEIFGPVLSVMTFADEEEALALANGTQYGLGAYVHTNDLRRAHRVSRLLDVGAVWVNGAPGLMPSAPFGGVGQSGSGRIGGQAGIREFLRPKNVWIAV